MATKGIKGKLAMAAASIVVAGSAALAVVAPASAATVPNRYYCNPNGGWCYQINGAYHPEVGRECHWKRSGMSGKPQQIYYTSCNTWGPDVP